MENKLTFIERDDPEFTFMFNSFPDKEMYNKQYGECLQYMGTVLKPSGNIHHEFRHRAVPGTNKRQYWQIEASNSFHVKVKLGNYKGTWS
jgi:hypothetical protein